MSDAPKPFPRGTETLGAPTVGVRDRRVLLIDDNHDQRDRLAHGLRAHGWYVDEARDAQSAIRMARQKPPDVVITELVLPDMPGFRLARTLRITVEPGVLILALTRVADTGIHTLARMAGIGDVIMKPMHAPVLHDRLLAVLAARDVTETQ